MARQKNGQKIVLTLILISAAIGISGCGEVLMTGFNVYRAPGEMAKEQTHRIYGKVVDQNGDPVPNAKIKLSSQYHDILNMSFGMGGGRHETEADDMGRFEFHKRGSSLSITKIERDGYEPLDYGLSHKLKTASGEDYAQKKDDPAIITMRKREQAEYLYNRRAFGRKFYPDKENRFRFLLLENWIDGWGFNHKRPVRKMSLHKQVLLMRRQGIEIPPRLKAYEQKPEEEGDVEVTGKFSGSEKNCEVRFTFLGTDGGVLLNDELIYEAPAAGYESEVIITLPFDKDGTLREEKYLYIKGEGGKTYSRLTLKLKVYSKSMIRLSMDLFTNPAGSRHLEYNYEVIEAETQRRKERGKRFRKIRNDAVEKYRAETKAKKERRNKDTEAHIREDVKESFKEMIRQEMLKEKQTNENKENG